MLSSSGCSSDTTQLPATISGAEHRPPQLPLDRLKVRFFALASSYRAQLGDKAVEERGFGLQVHRCLRADVRLGELDSAE